jgi:hypothetical protein
VATHPNSCVVLFLARLVSSDPPPLAPSPSFPYLTMYIECACAKAVAHWSILQEMERKRKRMLVEEVRLYKPTRSLPLTLITWRASQAFREGEREGLVYTCLWLVGVDKTGPKALLPQQLAVRHFLPQYFSTICHMVSLHTCKSLLSIYFRSITWISRNAVNWGNDNYTRRMLNIVWEQVRAVVSAWWSQTSPHCSTAL